MLSIIPSQSGSVFSTSAHGNEASAARNSPERVQPGLQPSRGSDSARGPRGRWQPQVCGHACRARNPAGPLSKQ
eukprot:7391873-Prymnesium_polylepis.2